MKIFYSLLLCQFIIFNIVQAEQYILPNSLNFLLTDTYNGENVQVPIYLVRSTDEVFLANKNLPVWVVEKESPTLLKRQVDIMREIGPFEVFRDRETCSAALFFHFTKQYEGTVENTYTIHKLTYNPETKTTDLSPDTLRKMRHPRHENRTLDNIPAPVKPADTPWGKGVQSRGAYPDTVYVEVLVMIHHDLTKNLGSDNAEIVKYVLALFNSVDMLYSKIPTPNIKINIAGIIIAKEENSFPDIEKCHQKILKFGIIVEPAINTKCVYHAIWKNLKDYQIPLESFDIVVFLTSMDLTKIPMVPGVELYPGESGDLFGQCTPPDYTNGYRETVKQTGIAIVQDVGNRFRFATLAHEIAHLLNVPHDGGPLWSDDGACTANLMRRDDSVCRKCLAFGGESPEQLRKFFGTSDSCIFRNKPRSLNPPGPQFSNIIKPRHQCECYGYESAYKPNVLLQIFSSSVDCGARLKCVDEKKVIHETNFYMDGTPCKKNLQKVCWNRLCKEITLHD